MIIDYSAWKSWKLCPAFWYEKYINKRQRAFTKSHRDDALALGSLVHEGLRIWQERHVIEIPEKVIEEISPTRECVNEAQELIYGYTHAYPEERWRLILCEQPLVFPLLHRSCECQGEVGCLTTLDGLAKLDSYFYVDEPTIVESGQPGLEFTLSPGWWVHEYKTKSPDIPLGLFIQKWEMNVQASFQMMALRETIHEEIQGVLVNILEKPKRYIPKRKSNNPPIVFYPPSQLELVNTLVRFVGIDRNYRSSKKTPQPTHQLIIESSSPELPNSLNRIKKI